jgi:hypothetical protein
MRGAAIATITLRVPNRLTSANADGTMETLKPRAIRDLPLHAFHSAEERISCLQ